MSITLRVFNSDQFKEPEAIAFANEFQAEASILKVIYILARVQERLLRAHEEQRLAAELVLIKWWVLNSLGQSTMEAAGLAMQELNAASLAIDDDEPKKEEVLN